MDQIRAMLEAMHKDIAFGKEMMELMKTGDTGEIVRLAAKKGFVFSEDDWMVYVDWGKKIDAKYGSKALSVEELDAVSGGRPKRPDGCWFHAASEPEYRYGSDHILPDRSQNGCG